MNTSHSEQADDEIPEGYEPIEECLLGEADNKFQEAHYFIEQMMTEYHKPEPFRFSLNAFLQALRSVTFFLQNNCQTTRALMSGMLNNRK
ncbi:MAG: hypothetical protein ACT4QE_08470 [Anaerolineales bacterium]